MTRDARPFVAHHLRTCADARSGLNGDALHALARWVENLPRGDPSMRRIAATDSLDYGDGSLHCGDAATALVNDYQDGTTEVRTRWLERFAEAVEHDRPATQG